MLYISYLVRVGRADENDGTFFWHFPATTWMHLSEEELHQDRECPQESIVDIFVHDCQLRALRILLFVRHLDDLQPGGVYSQKRAVDGL